MSSKKDSRKKFVQFSAYDENLPQRISDDVASSCYGNKTEYMNVLAERILGLSPRLGKNSKIEELLGLLGLIDSLPLDDIEAMAPRHNRHFDQMLKHVFEVGVAFCTEETLFLRDRRIRSSNLVELISSGESCDSAHRDSRRQQSA